MPEAGSCFFFPVLRPHLLYGRCQSMFMSQGPNLRVSLACGSCRTTASSTHGITCLTVAFPDFACACARGGGGGGAGGGSACAAHPAHRRISVGASLNTFPGMRPCTVPHRL